MIRINLNGEWVEDAQADPQWTILRYLRTQMAQVDVKEGCAGGDCGACTVMVGRATEQGLQYQSINACIALLATVHNAYVITPQGLAKDGTLHPAQQALIDHHGSQCGFCTPGFVMSMATLYQQQCQPSESTATGQTVSNPAEHGWSAPEDDAIHAALSGNLCRCTGYRPIIDAARAMGDYPAKNADAVVSFDPNAIKVSDEDGLQPLLQHQQRQLFVPHTEEQLKILLQQYPQATLWAGGTDLGLEISQRFRQFDTVICLHAIASLQHSQDQPEQLLLGAGMTYSQLEQELSSDFPSFAELLHRIGSRQVRNLGTLGGNIANASPIGDTPPVLLALGAQLEIDGIYGRHQLAAQDFFTGYKQTRLREGEYLRAIILPKLTAQQTLHCFKVSKRYDDDISAVMFAAVLGIDNHTIVDARVACGGVAATPLRASNVERALIGQPWSEQTMLQAAQQVEQDYQPIDDVRATKEYRLQLVRNLLLKTWAQLEALV
ncbi:xanthine dehydrogenase small subunit [Bacterioplanes sanyensis]|uniref:xanthine dehydrogenase small subunit n=1 Tax=Bacterioplanes sanyensis TaxID=1249553 RepID=UPI0012FD261F|nr:xanthine dehydrogenase small subunit [Bacterioplanes sanyensis]